MNKLRSGDEVIVIAGRDKGKTGKVEKIIADVKKGDRLIVKGINLVKRHTKPNPQAEQPGGIIEKEAAIAISNVAIFNPETGKGDRVGFQIQEDGKKVRIFKSNQKIIG